MPSESEIIAAAKVDETLQPNSDMGIIEKFEH
jgi:hypothetical protein